jgi:HPt (histidine-containing phosphotransfer) domain-containing protein
MEKAMAAANDAGAQAASIDMGVIEELRKEGGDLLSELVDMFVAEVPLELDALEAALHKADAGAARLAAHTLKGTASNFGAARMRMLAGSLEEKARNVALDDWSPILIDLRAEALRVRQALESIR